jgi:protein-disulfide isomerase
MQVVRESKPKCLFFLASLALLIVVIVLAVSGGGSTAKWEIPREPDATRRTYALLAGIPQRGSVLGYREAPVTLQFFGDLQCLDSRYVMLGALPFLIRRWVRTGKLQIRYRSTESDTSGAGGWPEFREQQVAALAAGKQGKLWHFVDVFYREQGPEFTGYADEAFLHEIAVLTGLELEHWASEREFSEDFVSQIEADGALAKKKGLESTPSFLIGPTGGIARPLRHFGLNDPKAFEEAIREVLKV